MAGAAEFYGRALGMTEQLGMHMAEELEGVDAELAVARLHLRRLVESGAEAKASDIIDALEVIGTLSSTAYRISKKAGDSFSENLAAVLREAGELMAVQR